MATYQFVIQLIPKEWVQNSNNKVEDLFDEDGYEISIAWEGYKSSANIELLLSQILPKGKSWSDEIEMWGLAENNDIQLMKEGGKVDSIQFRLDLRGDVENIKLKLISVAKDLNCYFFFPEFRKIIPPEFDALNFEISRSRAARFVVDPLKFLNEIIKENKDW